MDRDNISPGVGPDGTASRDYLDTIAAINYRRDALRDAALRYQQLGNPGARAVCLNEVDWLDTLADRIGHIENKYYARSLVTQGRRKQGEGE